MISNFRYFQISNYRRRRFVQLSEKQGGQSRGWQPKPGHLTLMNAAAAGSPHADACHPAPADQLDHSKAAFKRSPPPIAAARLRLWNSPHTHTHTQPRLDAHMPARGPAPEPVTAITVPSHDGAGPPTDRRRVSS